MLTIRKYRQEDAEVLLTMFLNTVRNINRRDYSPEQISAWASNEIRLSDWSGMLVRNQPFVAVLNTGIVGYADVQPDGLIDHFYTHEAYQRQGIGAALMHRIVEEAKLLSLNALYAHVSITAKPFFESFGFEMVREQHVEKRGVLFTNYAMQKKLSVL